MLQVSEGVKNPKQKLRRLDHVEYFGTSQALRLRQTLSISGLARLLYHAFRAQGVVRALPSTDRSDPFSSSTLLLLTFTSMTSLDSSLEKTSERRQLRDVKGNLVYRDKDDMRIYLSHIAEYTIFNEICFFLTFPLLLRRSYFLPDQWLKHGEWRSPDPTVIVPSGRRNPDYFPKYEDEPRYEGELYEFRDQD